MQVYHRPTYQSTESIESYIPVPKMEYNVHISKLVSIFFSQTVFEYVEFEMQINSSSVNASRI